MGQISKPKTILITEVHGGWIIEKQESGVNVDTWVCEDSLTVGEVCRKIAACDY